MLDKRLELTFIAHKSWVNSMHIAFENDIIMKTVELCGFLRGKFNMSQTIRPVIFFASGTFSYQLYEFVTILFYGFSRYLSAIDNSIMAI